MESFELREDIIKSSKIGFLSQGSILPSIKTPKNTNGHAVIITARCDIANKKYSHFVLLPIYSLSEWFCAFGEDMMYKKMYSSMVTAFNNNMNKLGMPKDCYKIYDKKDIIEALSDKLTKELSDILSFLYDKKIDYDQKSNKKSKETLIGDIVKNKNQGFYFIECLERGCKQEGYVVDLRSPFLIPSEVAFLISNGIDNIIYGKNKDLSNYLFFKDDDLIYSSSTLNSPYIEHLMQSFSQVFTRIGLDDLSEEYIENIVKSV